MTQLQTLRVFAESYIRSMVLHLPGDDDRGEGIVSFLIVVGAVAVLALAAMVIIDTLVTTKANSISLD